MYFDDLSPPQRVYKERRERQYREIIDLITSAGEAGILKSQVYEKSGIRSQVSGAMMRDMYKRQLIHIAGWYKHANGNMFSAMFAIGHKPDVQKPKPEGRKPTPQDKAKLKMNIMCSDEEMIMRKMYREHEAWKKTWKPHRDFAASWF
jgi:hypothetical protein